MKIRHISTNDWRKNKNCIFCGGKTNRNCSVCGLEKLEDGIYKVCEKCQAEKGGKNED